MMINEYQTAFDYVMNIVVPLQATMVFIPKEDFSRYIWAQFIISVILVWQGGHTYLTTRVGHKSCLEQWKITTRPINW